MPVDLLYLARFVHRKVFKTVTLVCLICFSWWGLLSGHELSLYKNAPAALLSRVANVVAHHDELLTQWRYIWMSKLGTNIFLISTTSNYLRSSAVCKISIFKVDKFVLPIFLLPKLRSVAQIEWKKHPYYFNLLLVQK